MELEQKSEARQFKPPEVESKGLSTTGKRSDEIPSVKIERLKKELD